MKRRFYSIIIFFFFTLLQQYSACPPNCDYCRPSSPNLCIACQQNFQLDAYGKCYEGKIQMCSIYGIRGQCYGCQPTYRLQLNRCIKDYSGCLTLARDGCLECGYGLKISNKKCIGVINCKEYEDGSSVICAKCEKEYTLHQGKCVDTQVGCAVVREEDGICSRCKIGFKYSGFQCVDRQFQNERCYVLGTENQCLFCKTGYKLINGECFLENQLSSQHNDKKIQEAISIPNCEIVDPKTRSCQKCNDRYYLNSGCLPVSPICDQYSSINGSCQSCKNGAIYYNSKCYIVNCLQFSNNGLCNECYLGYQLSQSKTMCTRDNDDPNCEESIQSLCTKCKDGYYFNSAEQICKKSPLNCEKVSLSNGRCEKCKQAYYVDQNGQCALVPLVKNCASANPQNNSACLKCQTGYYLQINQCLRIPYTCNNFNTQINQCQSCRIAGFLLDSQTNECKDPNCLQPLPLPDSPPAVIETLPLCLKCADNYSYSPALKVCTYYDENCLTRIVTGCLKCSSTHYLTKNNRCSELPKFCESAYPDGKCITCKQGYNLQNGICKKMVEIEMIEGCIQMNNKAECEKCSDQYYVSLGKCLLKPENCLSFNSKYGLCMICKKDYFLQVGKCVLLKPIEKQPQIFTGQILSPSNTIQNKANSDINCLAVSNTQQCIKCANRFYLDADTKKCTPVNILCKTNNQFGHCTSCYTGYSLIANQCAVSTTINQNQDPKCKVKDSNVPSKCSQCFAGFYFSSQTSKCQQINPLCATSDTQTGKCLSCYKGYQLSNGNCQLFTRDPLCVKYDQNQTTCLECASRYFFDRDQNKCTLVSQFCSNFDKITGKCYSCYSGYILSNSNECIQGQKDPNCKTINVDKCQQCFQGFYVSKNGTCEKLNPICKSHNLLTGACASCYKGYQLIGSDCVLQNQDSNVDTNCKTFSQENKKICSECYKGFIVIQGKCKLQNLFCKTIDYANGNCSSCWPGYEIENGNCTIISSTAKLKVVDSYCRSYSGNNCIECVSGFFFNKITQKCEILSPLCNGVNLTTGACLDCYKGYVLEADQCKVQTNKIDDPYCLNINSQKVCEACMSGYYPSKSGECKIIPISFCSKYSQISRSCTQCIQSYYLQEDKCIFPAIYDKNCIYYENSYCSKCAQKFYLKDYRCQAIDPDCFYFDKARLICYRCLNGKRAEGAHCI